MNPEPLNINIDICNKDVRQTPETTRLLRLRGKSCDGSAPGEADTDRENTVALQNNWAPSVPESDLAKVDKTWPVLAKLLLDSDQKLAIIDQAWSTLGICQPNVANVEHFVFATCPCPKCDSRPRSMTRRKPRPPSPTDRLRPFGETRAIDAAARPTHEDNNENDQQCPSSPNGPLRRTRHKRRLRATRTRRRGKAQAMPPHTRHRAGPNRTRSGTIRPMSVELELNLGPRATARQLLGNCSATIDQPRSSSWPL